MEAYSNVATARAERFSLQLMQQRLLTLYRELASEKGLLLSDEASQTEQASTVLTSSR
jgi:hypothetical protein